MPIDTMKPALGTYWEGVNAEITDTILNDQGQGFRPTELYITLVDTDTGQVVNGRDGVSNEIGIVDSQGKVTLVLTPADMVILSTKTEREIENRTLIWIWKWNSGANHGIRVMGFQVRPQDA